MSESKILRNRINRMCNVLQHPTEIGDLRIFSDDQENLLLHDLAELELMFCDFDIYIDFSIALISFLDSKRVENKDKCYQTFNKFVDSCEVDGLQKLSLKV